MYERIRNTREDKDIKQKEMADLFETSIDYLVGRTNEKSPYPLSK